MKTTLILTIIACCLCLPVRAQTEKNAESQVVTNLASQVMAFSQEKLYLQTDRPYYVCGEKIFFRTFLLHASFNRPFYVSRYVYVELISPADEVILRQQIRVGEDKMFYGALSLPEELPEGYYRIRSYTRYMENTGEESFYVRPIFIAHPNSSKTEMETKVEWIDDKKVNIALRFKNPVTQTINRPEKIELKPENSKKSIEVKPNKEGWFQQKIDIKDSDTKRFLLVDYKDESRSFSKFIYIPYKNNQPEINFYPEGGNLIAGQSNRVAFKALLPDGNVTQVEGTIYNSKGELQTTFATRHEGMGDFYLEPQQGESYYAHFDYNSQPIKVNLPEVKTNAYSLQAVPEKENFLLSVRKGKDMPTPKMYLLIHCQGIPTLFEEWDLLKNEKLLGKTKLKPGVNHLMLLNENFHPLSERLLFNNSNNSPKVEIQTDKEIYKSREHIKLDIGFPDMKSDTIPVTFAISVTDDKDIKLDTTTNIIAEMLLVSELKGKINNPAWYFNKNNEASAAADLLMLTHGWRNYHVPEALQGNIQQAKIRSEATQSLSGVLKTRRGKPSDYGVIQMTALGYDLSEAIEADKDGRFLFDGFEFPDSTAFHLFANNKKQKLDVEIYPDEVNYPLVSIPLSFENEKSIVKTEDTDFIDYIAKADQKYVMENGMRMIGLPEVMIRGVSHKKETRFDNGSIIKQKPARWISPDKIDEEPINAFEDIRWRLGVRDPERVEILYLVNGIPAKDIEDVEQKIHINEIAQAEYYYDPTIVNIYTMGIVRAGSKFGKPTHIIALTTWPPGYQKEIEGDKLYSTTVVPLGYQKPIEFYSPQYDTAASLNDPTPDLRSTIYWKPNVIAGGEKNASVDFYAADAKTTYSVVMEGVGNNRQLIYYKKEALIKVE